MQLTHSEASHSREWQRLIRLAFGFGFLTMLVDGIDSGVASFAVPLWLHQWHTTAAVVGAILGAPLFGRLIGSLFLSVGIDRWGRRRVLSACATAFGFLTVLASLATGPAAMFWLRLLAGLGFGGAEPAAIVLISEYAPHRRRVQRVVWMFLGFTIGIGISGGLAGLIEPMGGWPLLFVVVGGLTLLVSAGAWIWLPESWRYWELRGIRPQLTAWIRENGNVGELTPRRTSLHIGPMLAELWGRRYAGTTAALWAFYIVNSIALFFMQGWLPDLLVHSGISLRVAGTATLVYQLAGAAGGIVAGTVIERGGLRSAVGLPILGAVCVGLLGWAHPGGIGLWVGLMLTGFGIVGTQFIVTGLGPVLYEGVIRGTGDGVAIAVGKVGSILGPALGGLLVAQGVSRNNLFVMVGITMLLSAVCCVALARVGRITAV